MDVDSKDKMTWSYTCAHSVLLTVSVAIVLFLTIMIQCITGDSAKHHILHVHLRNRRVVKPAPNFAFWWLFVRSLTGIFADFIWDKTVNYWNLFLVNFWPHALLCSSSFSCIITSSYCSYHMVLPSASRIHVIQDHLTNSNNLTFLRTSHHLWGSLESGKWQRRQNKWQFRRKTGHWKCKRMLIFWFAQTCKVCVKIPVILRPRDWRNAKFWAGWAISDSRMKRAILSRFVLLF